MTYVEPPGWPEPAPPHDLRGAYRARHGPAAPETYEADEAPYDRPFDEPADATRPQPVVEPLPGEPAQPERPPQRPEHPERPSPSGPVTPAGFEETARFEEPARPEQPARSEPAAEPAQPAPAPRGRAGRNLPAAIGVGVSLGGVVLASLLLWRPAFLLVVALAAGIAIWEMAGAVAGPPDSDRPRVPVLPLFAGAVVMVVLAWFAGVEALTLGLMLTVLATMVWRLADGPRRYHQDIIAATLIAVYIPFLAGFAVLLARPHDGAARVIVTLAGVVLSDTGGYVAGVFLGRHPMAPSVSPKKSWEGLGGSLLAAAIGGGLLLFFVFHRSWWHGIAFGLAVAAVSVVGDLAESLLKRDLKVKDMSNLLPGHGGLMDRLDSILFAMPTAYLLLSLLAPAH